jgi:tetratricopeptide (TPR) repeat protein
MTQFRVMTDNLITRSTLVLFQTMLLVLLIGCTVTNQTEPSDANSGSGGGTSGQELPDWKPLWDFKNPAKTEQSFRKLLPQAEAAGDLSYTLIVKTQIARTLGLQMKFDQAHAELDTVEKQLTDDLPLARIRYLLERGRVFNSSDQKAKALPLFKSAWKIAVDQNEEPLAMDAAHMVAIAAEPKESLEWSFKAIDLAENSENPKVKGWLGPLYNNTAWTFEEQDQYAKAMELFKKGYDFRLKKGWTSETVIALWTIAHTQRKMGNLDKALATLKEVEAKWREIGKEPGGYTWEEFGECYLALGKEDEARPYFHKAWKILSKDKWLASDEPERLDRLKKLGGE